MYLTSILAIICLRGPSIILRSCSWLPGYPVCRPQSIYTSPILAAADLVFLFASTVYYVATRLHSPVTENIPFHGKASCGLMFGSAMLSYYASMGNVILMSLERYLAICHPLKHAYMKGKRRAVRMIFASWIISFAPATILTLQYSNNTMLSVKWPANGFYEMFPQQEAFRLFQIFVPTFF